MSKEIQYLTISIRMPTDTENRKRLAEAVKLGGEFFGGRIIGMSHEDDMSILDYIEQDSRFDDAIAAEARARIKLSHAQDEEETASYESAK